VARRKSARTGRAAPRPKARRRRPRPQGFVGRDASPVLDRYPPKPGGSGVRGPPAPAARPVAPSPPRMAEPVRPVPDAGARAADAAAEPPKGLITLERPFDVDQFAQQLGESSIRATVPRENLAEVLARVTEFMGFGIYVYTISIRPSPSELLKSFEIELHRVDFSPAVNDWRPFQDRGRASNPFGPGRDAAPSG
jgi:hypothetical protein